MGLKESAAELKKLAKAKDSAQVALDVAFTVWRKAQLTMQAAEAAHQAALESVGVEATK